MKWRQYSLTLALGVAVFLVTGYVGYRLELRPVSSRDVAKAFVVTTGDNASTVAKHLEQARLIRNAAAFVTYINFHGLRSRIKAGSYSLSPHQSADTIADILADGKVSGNRLVIPEGSTLAKITALAAEHGISQGDFKVALASPHTQAFLLSKPTGLDMEGYLFPDSYEVNSTTTAKSLVNAMLDTFGQRVTDKYVAAFAAQGLTLHQGLTLASIVEREVNRPADRPIVAQIFLKRFRSGISLGSDVTVKYASDLAGKPFNLNIDSPYNTRKNKGLPPGPICSPGLSSIEAVGRPAGTDYLYFLTGKDGNDYFAKTYEEHQRNITAHL